MSKLQENYISNSKFFDKKNTENEPSLNQSIREEVNNIFRKKKKKETKTVIEEITERENNQRDSNFIDKKNTFTNLKFDEKNNIVGKHKRQRKYPNNIIDFRHPDSFNKDKEDFKASSNLSEIK